MNGCDGQSEPLTFLAAGSGFSSPSTERCRLRVDICALGNVPREPAAVLVAPEADGNLGCLNKRSGDGACFGARLDERGGTNSKIRHWCPPYP
eukprot:CAMPEP_0198678872 /NCGR_PEP_ID=MMETSP1468-20131203/1712_1 /TAXON_ID=1461545 /ORGANISM="Mantoniella sp, Strain CCMP1436" /LENGTH=92 /DNA_ID=CAMNT_0044416837 /DNA_START=471 /DNA_END=750 /DNA_ORIENTATION=+